MVDKADPDEGDGGGGSPGGPEGGAEAGGPEGGGLDGGGSDGGGLDGGAMPSGPNDPSGESHDPPIEFDPIGQSIPGLVVGGALALAKGGAEVMIETVGTVIAELGLAAADDPGHQSGDFGPDHGFGSPSRPESPPGGIEDDGDQPDAGDSGVHGSKTRP